MESISELKAQRDALDKRILEAQQAGREAAIAHIRELMETHELTLADISARPKARASAKMPAATSGQKVAPKYRDAKTGDTWSGRGLKPKWLSAQLAAGKKLNDFAI